MRLTSHERGVLLRRAFLILFRTWLDAWIEFDGQPSVATVLDLHDRALDFMTPTRRG